MLMIGFALRSTSSTTYTPEEILAMLLEYARELAADFGEQSIDAAVIGVPSYFNQAERKAVMKAAEIANLKVLQLINNNIAGESLFTSPLCVEGGFTQHPVRYL